MPATLGTNKRKLIFGFLEYEAQSLEKRLHGFRLKEFFHSFRRNVLIAYYLCS